MRLRWYGLALSLGMIPMAAGAAERVIDTVLPALAYGATCSSKVRLRNLADTAVTIDVEGHQASGALAPLAGLPVRVIHLGPGQQGEYQLDIEEETTAAWVKIRERIPEARDAPVVALSGATECRNENQLRVANRPVAYPMKNPWFSGDVADLRGGMITIVNTTEQPARARACYSSGSLYSVRRPGQPPAELQPICSATLDIQIPPFGTREIPVERNGNSHFSLATMGESIVLEMLRPATEGVHIYTVDSSIHFGEEVPEHASR